jgi:transcriptional regulator GlxA family with amidase domain
MRPNVGSQVPLSRLCRIVGLSERGLRNAFYDVRGIAPKRSLLAQRLQGVRRALRNSTARSNTGTNIATEFGFNELGRLAAIYR